MAQWKEIKGYEGLYLVSDSGDIVALPKKVKVGNIVQNRKAKPIRKILRGRGNLLYESVDLHKNGDSKRTSVHRIVAEAFLVKPDGCDVVNHKDRNPLNNSVSNLEWCTQQYNNEYSHNKPVLQFFDGELVAEYKSVSYASGITGIKRTSINNALCGWSKTAGGYEWKYKEECDDLSH